MTLLAPWALWFSAVGLAVVALYLLKIKRRRQTVPALDFWRQLAGQTHVRSLFQRLKRWLSLLLWLAIVTCLILSVGNPVLTFGRIKPRSIAVILDNSASMQTIEEGESPSGPRTRLQAALEVLNDLTRLRPVDDEWMLIEAGRTPRVLRAWTRDRQAIRLAGESSSPHFGSVDLSAAKALAAQLISGKAQPAIVVLSDGAAGQVRKLVGDDQTVVYWPIGQSDDNLGITRFRARPHRRQSAQYAYIRVINASPRLVETRVVFELDDSTVAVEPLSVEGGESWEKTVVVHAPEGGVLRARIDRPDALAVDNEACAILEPIERASILLVTPREERFFFEQALVAMESLVDPEASLTISIEEYDTLNAAGTAPDVTLFNNCAPNNLPPSGSFVFVNAWPKEVPARVIDTLEAPELTVVERDHPLMRYLNLSAVSLARAKRVDLTQRSTVLARSSEGAPLIFLHHQPDRRFICLAFDVMESDLPFRNAFPLFLRNAVALLMIERSAWIEDQYDIGDIIEPIRPLPGGVEEVRVSRLLDDDIRETTLPVENGRFHFEDTTRRGPLRFTFGDETAYSAVNLADAGESRIAPLGAAQPPEDRLTLTGRLFGAVPWLAMAVVAALLVGLEWLTYHFRWTE